MSLPDDAGSATGGIGDGGDIDGYVAEQEAQEAEWQEYVEDQLRGDTLDHPPFSFLEWVDDEFPATVLVGGASVAILITVFS